MAFLKNLHCSFIPEIKVVFIIISLEPRKENCNYITNLTSRLTSDVAVLGLGQIIIC